jgi:hypothetical protein
MKDLRRLVATIVIISFSIAALMGIAALLSGGDFGETEGRILLTTVIVGTESVAVLCYLALAGHRLVAVGVVGGAVSLVAFGTALWLTWGVGDNIDGSEPWELLGVSVTLAASLAQASLLIALAGKRRIGAGLVGTLAAITVVAAMISVAIIDGEDLGDAYWRILGVVAILDVLGTVVLTAVGAFGRRTSTEAEPRLLSTAVESRLLDAARERGVSPSQLVADALDAFLTPR